MKTAVEGYVRGLNGNDYAAIARLAPPQNDAAELEGFGNRGRYKETLQLEREQGRWHIALGRNPDPVRSRETSSTTRP